MLILALILALLAAGAFYLLSREVQKRKLVEKERSDLAERYAPVINAEEEAAKMRAQAAEELASAKKSAEDALALANADAAKIKEQAAEELASAKKSAEDALALANADAAKIKEQAQADAASAQKEAERTVERAKEEARQVREKAKRIEADALETERAAMESADKIVSDARERAKEIAGDALDAKERAKEWKQTAQAMQRLIEGYGNEWLKPAYSLLDDLAEEFSYTEAGQKLKAARANSALMVKNGVAANCDYAEESRRETAIAFVIDAFNGKVDSLLSKVKADNYGVLEQKIRDAYALVNANGRAFRSAHILQPYLIARLDELKWATIVQELRKKAAEEQRELREKMREEEKARREYERAQKEAAKEEAALQKAMEKAKEMLKAASEEQKAKYEAQLADLQSKLKVAEEKSQRALSMAQQTKHGTVYVISNVGSFGEDVYKVGMTRRLEPLDRVKELGDASVPFPFDVHAFIESDDAPALETALHRELALSQMNKVNPRKEFFRIGIAEIKRLVDARGLTATWTMAAEAAEFRETQAIEERIRHDPAERARWEKTVEAAPALAEDEDE